MAAAHLAGDSAPPDSLKLSLPSIVAFALPGISTAALAVMMGLFMPRFFAQHMGLSLLAVGGTLSAARVIDTFVELPLGWAMDRTKTAIGRYRPWYILGVPVLALSVFMLFIAPHQHGMTSTHLLIWYLVLSVGSSIMTLGHGAWAATLATSYHQRSRVFGWMAAVATVGSVAILATPVVTATLQHIPSLASLHVRRIDLTRPDSVVLIGWAIVIALPVLALIAALTTPEPRTRDLKQTTDGGVSVGLRQFWQMIKSPTALRLVVGDLFLTLGPNLTSPIYIFFFTLVKHFTPIQASTLLIFYLGAPFVGAPLWAQVAKRLGKHRTLQLGTVLYAITQTTLMMLPAGTFWLHAAGMFAVGMSNACFALMVRAMLADYSDELRLNQGVQRVSLLYSFVGITLKLGTSLNTGITFLILSLVGFQAAEGAHNSAGAIQGLAMTYLFAPIVFVVIGGLCFFGYSLNEARHAEIRAALDARDATEAASHLQAAE